MSIVFDDRRIRIFLRCGVTTVNVFTTFFQALVKKRSPHNKIFCINERAAVLESINTRPIGRDRTVIRRHQCVTAIRVRRERRDTVKRGTSRAMKPVIQVAGVIDRAEAMLLSECGVTHIGFPLRLPVHHEDVCDDEAASIIKAIAPPVKAVLITYLDTASRIIELADKLGVAVVQLHGDVDLSEVRAVRTRRPTLALWKSLVVKKNNSHELAKRVRIYGESVDAFVTDTFDPATGAEGATGKTHDWNVSRRLVAMSDTPVILAGGLTPGNVREALLRVGPSGVDAHTGVEGSDGRKRKDLVTMFVQEALEGFRTLHEMKRDRGSRYKS